MKLKRILLVFIFIMSISSSVLASNQDIKITINGEVLQTDVSPKIVKNRTMVPMRAIFEAIDAEVHWEMQTQTVVGIKDCNTIVLQVNNSKAIINGKEMYLMYLP